MRDHWCLRAHHSISVIVSAIWPVWMWGSSQGRAEVARRTLVPGALRLLLFAPLAAAGAQFLCLPSSAHAAGPVKCRVGVSITSLDDFNYAAKTFKATLWVWANCPTKRIQPIKSIAFSDADSVNTNLSSLVHKNGVYWAQERVDGTFRYEWDLGAFPFDQHVLTIQLEDGLVDIHGFRYMPDTANSGVENTVRLREWAIQAFKLTSTTHSYHTTFGDPGLTPGHGDTFSHLTASVTIRRNNLGEFLLFLWPVVLAVALGLLGFFLPVEDLTGRVELVGAGAVVVVLNLLDVGSQLVLTDLSLLGALHALALVYLLGCAALSIFVSRTAARGELSRARVIDRTAIVVGILTFPAAVALLAGVVAANA